MVAERGPVCVAEKCRATAGTRFHDEEETGVAAATRNRSGQSRMLIFTGQRGEWEVAEEKSRGKVQQIT
ncbi:hypothetical protein V6N13_083619 [Hibiscus sabdariffa]